MASNAKYPLLTCRVPRPFYPHFEAARRVLGQDRLTLEQQDLMIRFMAAAQTEKPGEFWAEVERLRGEEGKRSVIFPTTRAEKPVVDAEDLTEDDDQGEPEFLIESEPANS